MAHQPPSDLQKLRRQLEASRWDLRCAVDDLEHSLNLPSRAREAIVTHPLKYALIALAGGAVATRVLPLVFRLGKPTRSARFMRTLLQAAVPLAAPYVLQKLASTPSFSGLIAGTKLPPSSPPVPARNADPDSASSSLATPWPSHPSPASP